MASNIQIGIQPIDQLPVFGASIMALEIELATYRTKLPELQAQSGKFALIHGPDVVGVYGTYEDALNEGYQKFGLNPFLVRQIQAVEQVQFVTRLLDSPCHI